MLIWLVGEEMMVGVEFYIPYNNKKSMELIDYAQTAMVTMQGKKTVRNYFSLKRECETENIHRNKGTI